MEYIVVWSYDNYVPAHLAMGRLKEEGIEAWLKDENTVTIDPILTNAVGGIKLMVAQPEAKRAYDLLMDLENAFKGQMACPFCHSHNIEFVSSPRKSGNWISALAGYIFGGLALATEKVYHCFNCSKEFDNPERIPPVAEQ